MMYPYMTLNDDTEIVHSEMKPGYYIDDRLLRFSLTNTLILFPLCFCILRHFKVGNRCDF